MPEGVIAALGRLSTLTATDLEQLSGSARIADRHPAGAQLSRQRPGPRRAGLILSGWACDTQILLDGRRQIFSILLPGDPVFPFMTRSRGSRFILALTDLCVADIPLGDDTSQQPRSGLAGALSAAAVIREERLHSHIVRLGRLSAYERVASLFVELRERLAVVGLVDQNRFRMPLTQEIMADALGLSLVHVNRTLQQLRREKLLDFRAGAATILRLNALRHIAGLDDDDGDDDFLPSPGSRSDKSSAWARSSPLSA